MYGTLKEKEVIKEFKPVVVEITLDSLKDVEELQRGLRFLMRSSASREVGRPSYYSCRVARNTEVQRLIGTHALNPLMDKLIQLYKENS